MKSLAGPRRFPCASLTVLTACFVGGLSLLAVAAQAATVTWSATPVSGNWSVGANWAGGLPPNPGDDLVFPASSTIQSTTNDLVAGFSVNAITFDGNGYRLAGSSIVLAATGIVCTSGSAPGTDTIGLPITITAVSTEVKTITGCTLTLSGAISGTGGLAISGIPPNASGTTVLSGNDTYTGATSVGTADLNGGPLIVNGTLSGTSVVAIDEAAGLGGSGTIASSVGTTGGTIGAGQGSSAGVLTTGSVAFGNGVGPFGFFDVKLDGTTVGTQYDQLNVNGTVTLGSGTSFLIVTSLGFVPAHGTEFTIIKNDGVDPVSGTFTLFPEGATFIKNSTTFQISYVGGDGNDVVLTVISPWVPTGIAVDAAGNGVLEPGEVATLQPTWMNSSGSSSTLTGAMTNFTGPAGPTYTNPDASGSYGTIANGASAQCSDCYTVEVTGTRPAQHWDATIDETVTPTSTVETWKLHVGDSFPDVLRSDIFYTFIETLFHNAITAGCGNSDYCPGDPNTRAQMAVFILKSEHGSSYTPPDCTGIFNDVECTPVPAFAVDWIEQLSHEGITGGCGSGNYCPDMAIPRSQMAVFLLKGSLGPAYVPPACTGAFNDVPCPATPQFPYSDWIEDLFGRGITAGCTSDPPFLPPVYCPDQAVTRGQMAVFLVKTFGLKLYAP